MNKTIIPASVEFNGTAIYIVKFKGNPYVIMKPIVEGMGLAWEPQRVKIRSSQRYHDIVAPSKKAKKGDNSAPLKASGRYGDITIPLQTLGGLQDMLCLPLNKLNGWLFSVNPEKVKPELRDAVIKYQEESSQVLNDYWNNGMAINPRKNLKQGFFERQAKEFKALKSIAKEKGLNQKERIRFATEKMIAKYGDLEGLFEIKHLGALPGDYPEEIKDFFETMDQLLAEGVIKDHGDKEKVVWIHMPTALPEIQKATGRIYDNNILYYHLKNSDRYIEQKNQKRSCVLNKPIRAWAFKKAPTPKPATTGADQLTSADDFKAGGEA